MASIFEIDSMMRNVGCELRTLLHILPIRTIVIAPAFPGRVRWWTASAGRCCPLATTAFQRSALADEPSHADLLPQQAGMEVGHLRLEQIAAGHEALQAAGGCPNGHRC